MKSTGLLSVATAALVATIAGVGGALPIVLAATQAVGATPEQTSSWVSGLGIATAISALVLSVRYRMPIIAAWSTPGAALIASTPGVPSFAAAVGAFVLAAVLILLTAAVRPLGRLIEKIPASIAAAMLAGILLRLVMAMFEHVPTAPLLVLPLYATLEKLDAGLLEAAADLGATPFKAFLTITLPLSAPGIVAGCLLVFIPSVGEFVIPDLLGGTRTLMIGKVLWDEFFTNADWPLASAVAISLLVLLVGPIMLFQRHQARSLERH